MTVERASGRVFLLLQDRALIRQLRPLLNSLYDIELLNSLSDLVPKTIEERPSCLLVEFSAAGHDPKAVAAYLTNRRLLLPVIFVLKKPHTAATVSAMKSGAFSVLSPPFQASHVGNEIDAALAVASDALHRCNQLDSLRCCYASLTRREADIFSLAAAGKPNKEIAADLRIRESTVKVHRGRVMRKLRVQSPAHLAMIAQKLNLPIVTAHNHQTLETQLTQ